MGKCAGSLDAVWERPFKIITFDWDGTAVPNRRSDAAAVTATLEELMKMEIFIVVVTGTNFGNIDRQFCSFVKGPHKRFLYVCANRGSEVFGFGADLNTVLLHRKQATPRENGLMDQIVEAVKRDIENRSRVSVDLVYDRLNRRKVDLIPEWPDPPKSEIGELIRRTDARLKDGGFNGGIKTAFELAEHHARQMGLPGARITSDVKTIEVGLTDKSDSIRWVIKHLCRRRNISFDNMVIAGDEFGPVAGFEGSDFHMTLPFLGGESGQPDAGRDYPGRPVYFSVGPEPNGVPEGVAPIGGGPDCFIRIMRRQADLNRRLMPSQDPSLVLAETGFDPLREREVESLMAIGNGYLGTRGSLEEQVGASSAATLLDGVYDRASEDSFDEQVIAPDWLFSRISINGEQLAADKFGLLEHGRTLDMEKGILFRHWRHRSESDEVTLIKTVRFALLEDPHAQLERITVVPENYAGRVEIITGLKLCGDCVPALAVAACGAAGDGVWLDLETKFTKVGISFFQHSQAGGGFIEPARKSSSGSEGAFTRLAWSASEGQSVSIEKFVSTYTSRESADERTEAADHCARFKEAGFDELFLAQARAWRRRRQAAAISVDEPESQKWLNFAGYHLISAGNPHDERTSISARALTGSIYKGHIFWDAEMFILPFFIFTHPPTARAMLMYRYHTLAAARGRAAGKGYAGALFAWESTITGDDMTPAAVPDARGKIVPVLSGKLEHHISAAVAWGVWSYWNATGDDRFMAGSGAEILIETARFWASRVSEVDGQFHIYGVEGPDEFHDEGVDDNFYTNIMARWNLSCAAEIAAWLKRSFPEEWTLLTTKINFDKKESGRWRRVAENMFLGAVTADRGNRAAGGGEKAAPGAGPEGAEHQAAVSGAGQDGPAGEGPIEQFTGYFGLEDIDLSRYEPRTAPVDVILGHDKTVASQLVKQADVVMALYLREEELSRRQIAASFNYYEPRTDHSSSLSPAVHGLVAARLGQMDTAWRYFRRSARIDLTGSNAVGGIHVAAMGGLWQQVVMGFAGIRISAARIFVFPRLPAQWRRLAFPLLWRGRQLRFQIERDQKMTVEIEGEGETMIGIWRSAPQALASGRFASFWDGRTWSDFRPEDDGSGHEGGSGEADAARAPAAKEASNG